MTKNIAILRGPMSACFIHFLQERALLPIRYLNVLTSNYMQQNQKNDYNNIAIIIYEVSFQTPVSSFPSVLFTHCEFQLICRCF